MKKLPPLLTYTVLRLLAFIVPFLILMIFPLFRTEYWLAAIFAALIGMSLSVLFLRRPFDASNTPAPKAKNESAPSTDADVEDDVIDSALTQTPAPAEAETGENAR